MPWAQHEGFTAYSPYLMVRERVDIGAKELIEVRRSNKYPYRMYTVNLGLFHPDFCEDPPSDPKGLSSMHCGREVRIGHLMSKSPWERISTWYRYGSGWDFLDIFPRYGDFWWQYGRSLEDTRPPVQNTLDHLASAGLGWFKMLRQHSSIERAFDPADYVWYEMPGAASRGVDIRLKPR